MSGIAQEPLAGGDPAVVARTRNEQTGPSQSKTQVSVPEAPISRGHGARPSLWSSQPDSYETTFQRTR